MKNKAFTLVELLGVIVLLGIISIVIIPKVGDSLENSKQTALLTQEEQIKKASFDFLVDHTELLESNTITLKLGTLKQGGYLPIKIKNPKTRKNISNESTITITKIGNSYEMTLNLIDLENASENIDSNSPILVLNGNYIEYIEVNEEYNELGAKAITSTGEEIDSENISIQVLYNNEETTITTNQLKTYSIVYSVTDDEGRNTSATRTVIVRDSTAPTIIVPKDTNIYVNEVAQFNNQDGVIINDNYDNNPSLTINSTLANIPGTYVITYTATDSSGNQSIEKRVIKVDGNFANYYTNLEYIESTGTQYIDTGYIPTSMTDMEIDFEYIGANTNNSLWYPICGERSSGGTTYLGFWVHKDNLKIAVNYGGYDSGNSTTQSISRNVRYNFKNRGSKFYLNDNMFDSSTTQVTKGTTPIYIFTIGNGSGVENRHVLIKLYSFKIYENNTLVRNMIPCLRNSDNKPGLYDLVNDMFYTNAGTDEFIKGEL